MPAGDPFIHPRTALNEVFDPDGAPVLIPMTIVLCYVQMLVSFITLGFGISVYYLGAEATLPPPFGSVDESALLWLTVKRAGAHILTACLGVFLARGTRELIKHVKPMSRAYFILYLSPLAPLAVVRGALAYTMVLVASLLFVVALVGVVYRIYRSVSDSESDAE